MSGSGGKITLFEDVTDRLKALIEERGLQPGDRLPAERELAVQLGVSRNTLREALKGLAMVGVLTTQHGGGSYLAEPISGSIMSGYKFRVAEQVKEVLDLFVARRAIEEACAEMAALHATPEQIEQIGQSVEGMRRLMDDDAACIDQDVLFHKTIARASGNPVLLDLMNALERVMRENMYRTAPLRETFPQVMHYHEAIYEGIKNRDSAAARRAMRGHLGYMIKELQKILDEKNH